MFKVYSVTNNSFLVTWVQPITVVNGTNEYIYNLCQSNLTVWSLIAKSHSVPAQVYFHQLGCNNLLVFVSLLTSLVSTSLIHFFIWIWLSCLTIAYSLHSKLI